MMKLSRRIRDLVRAGLASPRRVSGLGRSKSPERIEAQLEQIRKSLTRAAAREERLQDDLALAEQEGRERDAVRIRRELAGLAQSTHELRAALDLIEARIEVGRERRDEVETHRAEGVPHQVAEETDAPQMSLADEKDEIDLTARKARLSAPKKK
jgi:hypothetical protein